MAAKLLTVLGLGALELWVAIPVGMAFRLHPVAVALAAGVGAILGAAAVVLLGGRVRAWLLGRRAPKEGEAQRGLIYRIWQRYGVMGLGLLAPLLTGAPLGAALGVALGAPPRRLLVWVSAGVVLWSVALTLAATLGFRGIQALGH